MLIDATYIVTLPGEESRCADLSDKVRSLFQLSPTICHGVIGSSLPDIVSYVVTKDPAARKNKGALGCLLAHVKLWELITRTEDKINLILEDDAVLIEDSLHFLKQSIIPEMADIVFVNKHTASYVSGLARETELFIDVSRVVEKMDAGVGTYGYIMTKEGARRILDLFAVDLFYSHVDVRMIAYSLDRNTISMMSATGGITNSIKQCGLIKKEDVKLNSFISTVPVVDHRSEYSNRDRQDLLGQHYTPKSSSKS